MSYYLAASLVKLRDQINATWPNRSKTSDGWIGDASHQASVSDHNPDWNSGGVVRALDVDKDGINVDSLINATITDPRVAYVIWNGRIWDYIMGWKPYYGSNPHTSHVHISLKHSAAAENAAAWKLSGASAPKAPSTSGKSISQLATDVINGKYGNGAAREKALGSKFKAVQAEVDRRLSGAKTPPKPKPKTIAQLAVEVLAGKHGNGETRKKSLGSLYKAVQAEVERRMKKKKSVSQLADEVLAGKHGDGAARQRSLGSQYDAVQAEINRRYGLR